MMLYRIVWVTRINNSQNILIDGILHCGKNLCPFIGSGISAPETSNASTESEWLFTVGVASGLSSGVDDSVTDTPMGTNASGKDIVTAWLRRCTWLERPALSCHVYDHIIWVEHGNEGENQVLDCFCLGYHFYDHEIWEECGNKA